MLPIPASKTLLMKWVWVSWYSFIIEKNSKQRKRKMETKKKHEKQQQSRVDERSTRALPHRWVFGLSPFKVVIGAVMTIVTVATITCRLHLSSGCFINVSLNVLHFFFFFLQQFSSECHCNSFSATFKILTGGCILQSCTLQQKTALHLLFIFTNLQWRYIGRVTVILQWLPILLNSNGGVGASFSACFVASVFQCQSESESQAFEWESLSGFRAGLTPWSKKSRQNWQSGPELCVTHFL